MMRGKREDCYCEKCGWFGHMAYQCKRKETMEERRRKLSGRGNKFMPLQSKVCRRMEGGYTVCPYKGKVQPTRYWDMGRQDMSYGAVLVGRCSQEGQKCSMKGEQKGEQKERSIVNMVEATTGMTDIVMNWLDPIKELYDMYSEEEDTLRIIEIEDNGLDLDLDVEGPANPYIDL